MEQLVSLISLGDGSTLTLDFTTGVLDSRLTFTRGSNATFINSSGFVEWSASNHAPRTNWNFTSPTGNGWNAATVSGTGTFQWVGNGTVIAASGSAGQSFTVITTSSGISQGLRYVMSVTALSVTGSPTIQSIFDFTDASGNTYFKNGAAATSGTTVASGDRISVSAIANSTTMNVRLGCGAWFANRTNESVTLTQFHWHPGSAPVAYYENTGTSPRYDSARFDYNPTTLAAKGLLIEGSATNLARRSDDFNTTVTDGTSWTAAGYTAGTLSTTLPDGTTGNARRISIASGSGSFRSADITVTASTAYTFSFWARNNGGSQARFRVWNATAGSSIVDYTQSVNNYVSQIGGANNTSSTWVRVSVQFTTPAGCTLIWVYPTSSDSGTVDLLVWGAQVEAGSGASSYIPTGASQATRNRDQVALTNLSSINFSQTEGTCLATVEVREKVDSTFLPYGSFNTSGGGRCWLWLRHNLSTSVGTRLLGSASNSGGATALTTANYVYNSGNGGVVKFATSLDTATSSIVYVISGGAPQITTAAAFTLATAAEWGLNTSIDVNATDLRSMWVQSFKYWPTKLSNAQLQSLTL
jgi:hypothetical protein